MPTTLHPEGKSPHHPRCVALPAWSHGYSACFLWAQRSSDSDPEKAIVFLTIGLPDVSAESLKVDINSSTITASGHSATKNIDYATTLELFGEIDAEKTKRIHTARGLELVLYKKELKEEFWPRLLKEKGKVHFLRTDFDKWVDEDEQEGNPDDEDFMNKMGGAGGAGGMGGMEGMGGMGGGAGGFEGIDFSKLGAGPGMGGMGGMGGMPGMPGMGDDEDEGDDSGDDDDDDEMPELEGEDTKTGASDAKGKSKIEEVE